MPGENVMPAGSKANETHFSRAAETESLVQGVIAKRKSMLLFGEAGAGKTRLLRGLAASHEHVAFVKASTSARELLIGMSDAMRSRSRKLETRTHSKGTSLASLRGMVERSLDEQPWILFLDQLQSPSNAISHLLKELNYYDRTPILFAARSEHMEDTGGLRSLCLNRTSRVALKAWPAPVALEFTQQRNLSGRIGDISGFALKCTRHSIYFTKVFHDVKRTTCQGFDSRLRTRRLHRGHLCGARQPQPPAHHRYCTGRPIDDHHRSGQLARRRSWRAGTGPDAAFSGTCRALQDRDCV